MHPLALWQAVILGLVEGVTEYLPISSTGHLIIAASLMHLQGEAAGAIEDFEIIIQGGAILAVVGLYWPSVVSMVRGVMGKDAAGLRLLVNLFIAFLPSAVVGLMLGKWIERHLFALLPVLVAMLLGGVYMIAVDLWGQGRLGGLDTLPRWRAKEKTIDDITPGQALMIGVLQCASLWPGTSRSMMTITGGMFAGLRPKEAARFSFLLGLPTLTAATLYKLYKNVHEAHKTGTPNLFHVLGMTACIVGIAVAAVFAAAAVKWLVGFIGRRGLVPFGWYRIVVFVVLVVLSAMGVVRVSKGEAAAVRQPQTIESPVWVGGEPHAK